MKLRLTAAVLALALLLCSCGIERSYSSVEMHTEAYFEDSGGDTLRAENYSDLVNALMLLVASHADEGVVRVYGQSGGDWDGMAASACSEVQQTDLGSYLLRFMTYQLSEETDCYVVHASFSYRRSAEEYASLVNVTSEEAVPELLREAAEKGALALTVRLAYFPENEENFIATVEEVRRELQVEEEWSISFHRGLEDGGIIEIVLI